MPNDLYLKAKRAHANRERQRQHDENERLRRDFEKKTEELRRNIQIVVDNNPDLVIVPFSIYENGIRRVYARIDNLPEVLFYTSVDGDSDLLLAVPLIAKKYRWRLFSELVAPVTVYCMADIGKAIENGEKLEDIESSRGFYSESVREWEAFE